MARRKNIDVWSEVCKHITLASELSCDEFKAAYLEWAEDRRYRGKPLTPKAIKMQIEELQEHGAQRAIAAIRRSIASGWTGLFPETANVGRVGGRSVGRPTAEAEERIVVPDFRPPPPPVRKVPL